MPLDFSAGINRMTAHVIGQISNRPNALFPYNEGWRRILPHKFTPERRYSERYIFFLNGKQLLSLFFFDRNIELKHCIGIPKNSLRLVSPSGDITENKHQFIFICDGKDVQSAAYMLDFYEMNNALLVYDFGRLYFQRGRFTDRSLHQRFKKHVRSPLFFQPSDNILSIANPPDPESVEMLALSILQVIIRMASKGDSQLHAVDIVNEVQESYRPIKPNRFIRHSVDLVLSGIASMEADNPKTAIVRKDKSGVLSIIDFRPVRSSGELPGEYMARFITKSFLTGLTHRQTQID